MKPINNHPTDIPEFIDFEIAEFKAEKVQSHMKISRAALSDLKLKMGTVDEDFMKEQLTVTLTGYIYANTIAERTLTHYCTRPTFLDWLLRRQKTIYFNFSAKDLYLNPPKTDKPTLRVYYLKEVPTIK